MTTVDTSARAWIGNQLCIEAADFAVPEGYTLAPVYELCSAHQRSRGVYLGRRWYLQEYGRSGQDESLDLVSPKEDGDAGLRCCLDFLTHHGYRCKDEHCGIYSK